MRHDARQLNFRRKTQSMGAIEIVRRLHRRHVVWYGIAVLASLLLHLLLILLLPGISAYKIEPGRAFEKPISLRLEDVKTAPETPDSERRPPKFKPDAAKGAAVAGTIGTEMTTVRRSLDESSVEPRQVGAGVLIGEQRTLAEPVPVDRPLWEPRQEILSINQKIVKDNAAVSKPRRYVQVIPRGVEGTDIAAPASREALERGISSTGAYYLVDGGYTAQ